MSEENIQRATWAGLAGGYLYVFARSNVLLYPRQQLEKTLLTQFPALASVSAHASNFHTLEVDVVEREPAALWCGDAVASSTSCFLIGNDGIIYAPAVVYSGDAYQRYYGFSGGVALPRQFLTAAEFHSLVGLVGALQQKESMSPQSIFVDESGDVHLAFDNGFTLLFSATTDSADVLDRFELALRADPFKTHPLSDFEYLDLRFGDKLYYKLKT